MSVDALTPVLFYVFAGVALAGALTMVTQRHPIGSAFAFIVVLCSLSAIYGLLGSPFIAALQIVVYAGAIMVLFLFVIMLLNVKREDHPREGFTPMRGAALGLSALLVLQVGSELARSDPARVPASYDASTRTMARLLFSTHFLYVFEATSILILAALVGAIVLARKEHP
jgi:NADH-quinone oxidoreductase subunit J